VEVRSARRRLLFRDRRRHGHESDRPIELANVEASPRSAPVSRRELEIAFAGPVRHDADDLREVAPGVEVVELARGDEREEVRGRLRVIARAAEEPSFPPMRSSAQTEELPLRRRRRARQVPHRPLLARRHLRVARHQPVRYLADVLARVQDHSASALDELLPGAWAAAERVDA